MAGFLNINWGRVRANQHQGEQRNATPAWWSKAFGSSKKKKADTANAMQLTAVWACIRVKADTLAAMPLRVYEQSAAGKTPAPQNPASVLLTKPNEYLTQYHLKKLISTMVDLYGNFYAVVDRDNANRPVRLEILLPTMVRPQRLENGTVEYLVQGLEAPVASEDMVHVRGVTRDGLNGISPIKEHAEQLGLAFAAEAYGADFFENGGTVTGALTTPEKLTPPQVDAMEDRWKTKYGPGGKMAGSIAILHSGAQYTKLSVAPEEAQFLETRKYNTEEISRIFGVPLHMINSLDRATFNNIEQQALDFHVNTMLPLCVNIEEELNVKLFTGSDVGRFYCKFTFNSLMRADAAARMAFYKDAIQYGIMSRNEVRALEEQNPIDNETAAGYYVPSNIMPDDVNRAYFENQQSNKTTQQ